MNLQAGLDELRSSILRDLSDLKTGPGDHFWSDDSLILYINDAHMRFARKALCIRDDTTPEVTQVTLAANVDIYTLNPSVLSVVSARHQDDKIDLKHVNHDISGTSNPYTETFDFASFPPDGKPTQYSTDEGLDPAEDHAIRMRVYGMPIDGTSAGDQTGKLVYLRVCRKPLVVLTNATLQNDFEIPSDWHLDMLEWAAWRALRNLDMDGEDRKKAEQHKARFEEAVREARLETLHKIYQPPQWGFGGNGFSYVHN